MPAAPPASAAPPPPASDAPAPVRSLVIWVPDWPVVALRRESGGEPGEPVAVFAKGVVVACSAAARADGVRRGQRRRDAQARCPGLRVAEADEARDHRQFAPLVARLEEMAPGVQVLQPGLCALRARGPARFYGGETEAAGALLAAVTEGDIDARAGLADGPFTAQQAARARTRAGRPIHVVEAGRSAEFLAPLSIAVLDDDTVDLFARLGVQTLGDLAAIHPDRLVERFGFRGARLHALAAGADSRPVTPRTPPPELHREVAFEPPLEIADQVAFGMRVAAEDFIAGLGAVDLVCTELRVILTGDRGETSNRVWLHPGTFDAAAVVDRVRWQLAESGKLVSGVAKVTIEPEAVDAASHHAVSLFGSGPEQRVHHALSRVQAMLGHRGVVTPVVGGGRWLSERQVLVPWGDRSPNSDSDRPWPGSLPDPLPSTVYAAALPLAVVDRDGDMVAVDGRGEPTAVPAAMVSANGSRGIRSWAGPWPVFERLWDPERARRAHRFQVVDATQTAWLLVCDGGEWFIEGRYD
ncbi:DNA polymerase Y family protein [Microbacterium radiodurans]|uniref:DNA polymerase Y family protein n=1 Tax=Microbacterium radiodurans TaxID=661398 RepID=A0A5J5ITQ7_9MICO|nr:DNA polymerase Y family protein [Microbacterium radiodurans]KAA9085399.1 DNA polymerase Y family protein [Microbacterium radiodurans]